jgi:hypothetical protein
MNIESTWTLIEAANKGARVMGLAYSGGKMVVGGWGSPIVMDLSGMTIPATVPLLANHENKTSSRVGVVRASVVAGTIEIEGDVVSEDSLATDIVNQAKAGASWQLSIGADVKAYTEIKENEEVNVNGTIQAGPFALITSSVLREVSVVAIGADVNTEMRIAASWSLTQEEKTIEEKIVEVGISPEVKIEASKEDKGDLKMEEEKKVDHVAEIRAEHARISAVKSACAGYPEVEAKAIAEGMSMVEAKAMILDAVQARKGSEVQAFFVNTGAGAASGVEVVEAAAMLATGGIQSGKIEAHYSEKVLDAADKMRNLGLKKIIELCASYEGKTVEAGALPNVMASVGFSTVSLPKMLGNIANKAIQDGYASQANSVDLLFERLSTNNFQQHTGVRLGGLGQLEKVQNGGPIKHGTMAEEFFNYQVETFAKIIGLTREMIVNDDLGGFTRIARNMGIAAANTREKLGWDLVKANTGNFFHSTNDNIIVDVLGIEGVSEAEATLALQTGIDGEPISLRGQFLVVPPQLMGTARAIFAGAFVQGSSGTTSGANIYQNVYTPEMVAHLGTAATAWYLWSATNKPFGIAYLNGQNSPTVEDVEPGAEFLGRAWRCFIDMGVCQVDKRGAVKSTGAGS